MNVWPLVSDFNTTTSVDAFTRSTLLDADANKDSTISAPSGRVFATKGTAATATNPEQSAYTQTFTVNVGEILRADYSFGTATAGGAGTVYQDFGIFLGAQPTDLTYTSGTVSTRANYVAVYGNNQTTVSPTGAGTVKAVYADGTSVPTAVAANGAAVGATGLFISRNALNTYVLGYVNASGNDVVVNTVTLASGVQPTTVGLYSDLRGSGTTLASLDNLQSVSGTVPEPAAMALFGLGGLVCLRRRE